MFSARGPIIARDFLKIRAAAASVLPFLLRFCLAAAAGWQRIGAVPELPYQPFQRLAVAVYLDGGQVWNKHRLFAAFPRLVMLP
jgi:hypothetical protein